MIFQSTFAANRNRDMVSDEELSNAKPYDGLAANPTPSWYTGAGTEFFRGMGSGFLKSMSSAETALSASGIPRSALNMYETETGESLADIEKQEQEIVARLDREAKEHRRIAREEWGLENAGYGWAGELMYGFGETLPKAIGYSMLLGGMGGAVKAVDVTAGAFGALAYGADVGISEYNELRDKGVDKDTAIWAGLTSFGAGAVGLKVPATFGKNRLSSAVTGSLVNMGLTGAEVLGISYILDNQNYTTLAKQYQLDTTSMLVSGVFGGVMGGVLWRPNIPSRPKMSEAKKAYSNTTAKFEDQLRKTGLYTEDEIKTQAQLHGEAYDAMVSAYGANVDGVDTAPDIVYDESAIGFNQIIGERGLRNLDQAEENWTRTNNLMTAKQMYFGGKDAKTVRLATGWERGADGKWRYEIPDIQLKEDAFRVIDEAKQAQDAEEDLLWQRNDLSDDEFIAGVQSIAKKYEDTTLVTKLEDVVEAPELFAAYPQLKGLAVEFGHLPKGTGGYYASGSNTIRLSRDANILKNSTRSTLAHEIQHAIQEIEGFAKGASPEIMMSKDAALWRDMVRLRELRSSDVWKQYKKLSDEYFDRGANDPLTWAEIERLSNSSDVIEVNKEIDRLHQKWGNDDLIRGAIGNDYWEPGDPFAQQIAEGDPLFAQQQYMKVAGEVEARNVQKRLYMSDADRLSTTLEGTEDRPRSEQIVLLRDALYRQMMYPPIEVEPKFELITVSKDSNGVEHKVWGVNGNPDLTVLPDNVEGIKPLPIRLQESTLKSGHIDKHLPDLRKAGYESIEQAIWDISQNYTAIYKGKKEGQLILSRPILVESDGRLRKGILYTEFQEVSGSYRVGSVVASANPRYLENKQPLWEKSHTNRLVLANRTRGLTGPEQLSTEASIAQTESSVNAFVPDDNLIESAKENFGITNDVREAFYILPDGTMLDGSGRHWGGDERDVAGTRQVDHADIAEVLDSSGAKAMYEFMGKTGAMRFDANARIASIARKPTVRQLAVLNKTFRGDYSALSFNTPEGRIVDDIEFESTTPSKVRSFFDEAQAKADNGVAGAYAQKEMGDIRGAFNPTLNRITLTPNANLSTFSHEMGHVYLNMAVDIASSTTSDLEFRKDVNKLLQSYGIKNAQEFASMDLEAQRKVHETFASHLEIYLSTGKAPKTSLQKIFDKIGLWLLSVYRYVGGPERAIEERFEAEFGDTLPKPSDEVLEFLDKLFSMKQKEVEAKAPKVDNELNAAARTVLQKVYTDKKFTAIAEKIDQGKRLSKREREYVSRMVQAGREAEDQINNGEKVDVGNSLADLPINERLIKDRGNAFLGGLNEGEVVLQNRDRSLPSSIAQMRQIASDPDYLRLGHSNFFSQGSPVIANGASIPAEQRGNTSFMVDANGKRYEVQYAVVEANDVVTSNNIDGTSNLEYQSTNAPKAVAGNGRVTGLKEAYRINAASKYRSEMTSDTMTGVNPNVIKKMKNPILVRVMRNEDVTSDIGDISNRSETAQLSDVEQAATDARRLDLSAIRYGEDGDVTRDSVVDFLQALPAEERARMIDALGNPTKSAFDRLDRAIMQAAYGNPNLTALLSTTEKTGISRLLSAARQIAPRVLGLEGEMDFRDAIVEVLGEIQNAKLSGAAVSLEDIARQTNITRTPEADAILQFLANNEISKGGIANIVNVFTELAEFAHANIDNAALGPDMFGETYVPTRKALMKKFSEITGVKIDENDFDRSIEIAQKAIKDVVDDVKVEVETLVEQSGTDSLILEGDLEQASSLLNEVRDIDAQRARAQEVLNHPNKVTVENLALDSPDMTFDFIDENGNKTKMTAKEVLEMNERDLYEAEVEDAAMGRAIECIVNNNGV